MLKLLNDDLVHACGWPWHGKVVIESWFDDAPSVSRIQLFSATPGVAPRALPFFGTIKYVARERCTWIFDMGLPDVEDEVLAAEGGAWWGRAILRDGLFWSGAQEDTVVPIWWSDDVPRRPVMLDYRSLVGDGRLSINAEGRSFTKSWTHAELGQSTGQPDFAAPRLGDTRWFLCGHGHADFYCRFKFLGAYENRLLLGVWLSYFGNAAPLPDPPGTGAGWPISGLAGLVEVEIDKALFGPDPDPDLHIRLRVIEDRQAAAGNPSYHTVGAVVPWEDQSSSVTAIETSALLTAWYGEDGSIRSARYNRMQVCERERVTLPGSDFFYQGQCSRSTTFELLYDGVVVDRRVLAETLAIRADESGHHVTRTINETGEQPDVAEWTGAASIRSDLPDLFSSFRAGQGLVMGVVAYTYAMAGYVDEFPKQDIRLMWLYPSTNNTAALLRSREPYDYGDADRFEVSMYAGPCIGPKGPLPGTMSKTVEHLKSDKPWVRSFFYNRDWLLAIGNPVTGEVARAAEFYPPPGVRWREVSWV